jgi:hypothetical protein
MKKTISVGEQQLSALEINILDPAHDDEREDWWPTVEGKRMTYDTKDAELVWRLLVEAANSEDAHAEMAEDPEDRRAARQARDALTALSARVLRSAKR